MGFEAAVAALGLKANVSEADHPLLCEGTRRQRGDLAVMLLVHYKDDPDKLAKIMEKLLDRQVHPLYKAPLLSSFYTNNPTPMGQSSGAASSRQSSSHQMRQRRDDMETGMAAMALDSSRTTGQRGSGAPHPGGASGGGRTTAEQSPTWDEDYAHWDANSSGTAAGAVGTSQADGVGNGSGGSGAEGSDSRHSMGAAHRNRGVVHRSQRQSTGPGSDSGSSGSGKSSGSDSFGSRGPMNHPPPSCNGAGGTSSAAASFLGDRIVGQGQLSSSIPTGAPPPRHHQSIPDMSGSINGGNGTTTFGRNGVGASGGPGVMGPCGNGGVGPAGLVPGGKVNRFKNKRLYPSVPNQPSEASAHFMFELAKTVLLKAGGNSSTSLFTQPINSQNPRGPIRALQMCAFQIGLYALGLHNCVSAKWLSRTYSSHVSWITGKTEMQAISTVNCYPFV